MTYKAPIIVNLLLSIFIMAAGMVLLKWRASVSEWAIEMRKTYNSFLLRSGSLAEITAIAVGLILYGLMLTVGYVVWMMGCYGG